MKSALMIARSEKELKLYVIKIYKKEAKQKHI